MDLGGMFLPRFLPKSCLLLDRLLLLTNIATTTTTTIGMLILLGFSIIGNINSVFGIGVIGCGFFLRYYLHCRFLAVLLWQRWGWWALRPRIHLLWPSRPSPAPSLASSAKREKNIYLPRVFKKCHVVSGKFFLLCTELLKKFRFL